VSWPDPCQGTLASPVRLEGVGIHTGRPGALTLRPAAVNRGRVFLTADGVEVPARVDFVVACDRSTILGHQGARVSTPEHLLSALSAAGIDNLEIEIEGEEVPILDGSALPFWQAIQQVGRESQGVPARTLVLDKPLAVGSVEGAQVLVLPAPEPRFEYLMYYPHPMLGAQSVAWSPRQDYAAEVAPARTFALWEEVQPLLARGKAMGGSLDNALVVHQDSYSTPLRLPLEPGKHKLLDLIGDFALLDARLQARVLAVRAGHRWHVEAARKVWEETL
jgi:UDP-3-O-acyl N-acetylglucosamine deacetylase